MAGQTVARIVGQTRTARVVPHQRGVRHCIPKHSPAVAALLGCAPAARDPGPDISCDTDRCIRLAARFRLP